MDLIVYIVYSIQVVCCDFGLFMLFDEVFCYVIGFGLWDVLQIMVLIFDLFDYVWLVECYCYYYLFDDQCIELFVGVCELFVELCDMGYLFVVVIGKGWVGLNCVFDQLKLMSWFDVMCCVDEMFLKLYLVMLYELLWELGQDLLCIVMIGDMMYDLQMVVSVGVVGVGVVYGVYMVDVLVVFMLCFVVLDVGVLVVWLWEYV